MKEKKNVLVFCYSDMRLGGIQKIIYGYVEYFLTRGGAVIWVAPEKHSVDPGHRKLINPETITICSEKQAEAYLKDLCGTYDTTVVILSFRPSDYLKMAKLEAALPDQDIRNYMTVAHYKGTHLFLEENYRGRHRSPKFEIAKSFYEKLLENKSLFFCSLKQAEAFEAHYGIPMPEKSVFVIPASRVHPGVGEDCIRGRHGKQNIISVCRFSFPHKGYVLGLIRAYGTLKETYPKLKLTLIGYGDGTARVEKELQALKPQVRKDVTVIPGVSTDKLPEYFAEASVAVGLAGAASTSAAAALITLVARHYCETGEVYGSYPDCWEKTVSEEPGVDMVPQLERVLNLDEESYLAESLATRRAYENRVVPRLKDICTDYGVGKTCLFSEAERNTLEEMSARAEKLLRQKRYRYLLTHPGQLIKKLKSKLGL